MISGQWFLSGRADWWFCTGACQTARKRKRIIGRIPWWFLDGYLAVSRRFLDKSWTIPWWFLSGDFARLLASSQPAKGEEERVIDLSQISDDSICNFHKILKPAGFWTGNGAERNIQQMPQISLLLSPSYSPAGKKTWQRWFALIPGASKNLFVIGNLWHMV